MNCSRELVEAFFDDELDAGQRAAIEQHLVSCPDCAAWHARLKTQRAGIRSSAPYYNAPSQLHRAVRDSLRKSVPAERAPRQPYWRTMAIAACLLLAVSVSWNVVQL